ncbi:hypothetical protein ACQKGO_30280 [Corallococcus interemptor]|uniref:hypothetical protein n=1 Tax=Corallococcus interemptor TaxID=2316720 RepID=UPI003D006E98
MTWSPALRVSAGVMLAACGGPELEVPAQDVSAIGTVEGEANSPIHDRARAFAAANPKRDGGSWNQWCGSLMVRFGQLPDSAVRPTARGRGPERRWRHGVHGHVQPRLVVGRCDWRQQRVWLLGEDGRAVHGSTGPIDGLPGPNTYKAEHPLCAYAVNRAF